MSQPPANRLVNEPSPYLQRHVHHPIKWQPWDTQALEQAKKENKPILLIIGYAACRWCNVMAAESFEEQTIADLVNQHFVCIIVDRQLRPDLDRIYQSAVQILTQQSGGWPLTVFLSLSYSKRL